MFFQPVLSCCVVFDLLHLSPPLRFMRRPLPKTASTRPSNYSVSKEVPDTEPRELPVDKWAGTLQSLLLQNNNIRFLPDYMGGLSVLARLDISK